MRLSHFSSLSQSNLRGRRRRRSIRRRELGETGTVLARASGAVGDAATGQVVGRELDLDGVADEDTHKVLAHFTGGGANDDGLGGHEFDAELGVGQGFLDNAVHLLL